MKNNFKNEHHIALHLSLMERSLKTGLLFIAFLFSSFILSAQNAEPDTLTNIAKNIHIHDDDYDLEHEDDEYDHLHDHSSDSTINKHLHLEALELAIDTTRKINYWHITERTGEIIPAYPDTCLTDYFNRTNVEGFGTSEAYLGNLGQATESRIFFDRNDRSHFLFDDGFYRYMRTPRNFIFMNTKVPHTNVSYQRAGDRAVMEERFGALLAVNFGKKWNIGADVDYLYARGYYQSQAAKHFNWSIFTNYLSDRHQLHAFVNPTNSTMAENGGVSDAKSITHPDQLPNPPKNSQEIETNFTNTWNNLKGIRYFLNYHYNLGFEKETPSILEGDTTYSKQFIPVSSIIYTFDYEKRKKSFYTSDSLAIDGYYNNVDHLKTGRAVDDSTSYWSLKNTLALSLREGFSEWAKFDLSAFITHDYRNFTLMDTTKTDYEKNQSSTYIGGELAKRKGNILRYNAQASFGVLGYNIGDMDLSGMIETRIPVWGDTASVKGKGFIKNTSPTFYENNYRSKYFWWNNDFNKVKKVYIGGEINIPHTNTGFSLGVENITDYIYFDHTGYPKQHDGSIQILGIQLNQNFQYRALHWDNRLAYQKSGNQDIIPLPDFAAYSSLYIQFKIAKVLTIQMGANVHYWTEYYAPTYEPATQQFKLQNPENAVKVGNYPLINGFVNCHLKQTRFFIEYYNASAKFISPPEYFSLPNYPVNPTIIKLGLSVDFIN